MTPRFAVLPIAVAALAIAGCGINNPYQTPAHSNTTTATTAASTTAADGGDPPSERGGTIPQAAQAAQAKLATGAALRTRDAALQRYATLYTNWNAAQLPAVQHQLAGISLGQARVQAEQAAASAARDTLLTRSHVHNSGQIIAITKGQQAARGSWVLVTREQTTGQGNYTGLPPTLHVIYARLTDTPQGWLVSTWLPQN